MKGKLSAGFAKHYKAVVTGGSAGGVEALRKILAKLSKNFGLPLLAVQHLHPNDCGSLAMNIRLKTALKVIEPCDKEGIEAGCVYIAPANYHMLVEPNRTIALSIDEKVNWSRPSIDVFFESAAAIWGSSLVGIILSGANADGAKGICAIKSSGGLTVAQAPASSVMAVMPQAAIDTGAVDKILPPLEIAALLQKIGGSGTTGPDITGTSR